MSVTTTYLRRLNAIRVDRRQVLASPALISLPTRA